MVGKLRKQPIRWTPFTSRVVALRLALGQSVTEIAKAIGCCADTVRAHVDKEKLDIELSDRARLALAEAVEAERILAELQTVEPGSPAQARLRTSLKGFRKQADEQSDFSEGAMEPTKTIGEMSDDELRVYVASLVPGLEVKSADSVEQNRPASDGRVSVSDDGEAGPEAARTGNKLA